MIINYVLRVDPETTYRSAAFHAIFIDGKFAKFIRWDGEGEKVTKTGEPGDRLVRALKMSPVSADDLRKEAESQKPPPEQTNPFMAAILRPYRDQFKDEEPTADDYKRNAELRAQFNSARLDIGMTEPEVETALRARPIEAGELDAGSCNVYGSKEVFPIDKMTLHFNNIVVVFRGGKAIAIFDFGGYTGKVQSPNSIIGFLKRRDAEVDSAK